MKMLKNCRFDYVLQSDKITSECEACFVKYFNFNLRPYWIDKYIKTTLSESVYQNFLNKINNV
jgi:hypothetical protein